jgi:hypothetical protein
MPITGPTGEFPFGVLDSKNHSGIYAGIIRVPGRRALRMDFGTELSWLAVPPYEALTLAHSFREIVQKWFGAIHYDVSILPMRVTANRVTNVVECSFSSGMSVLVANPEVYLAWADRLTQAASKLTIS